MDGTRRDKWISGDAADKLIAAHDGDVALLYIYLARHGGRDLEQAARALCRTMGDLTAAEEKLRRMGLLPEEGLPAPAGEAAPAAVPPAPPPLQLPEYRTEDITRRSREDGAFSVILSEAEKVVGHALSSGGMKTLFGIYDYLRLPPEVILELLNYCAQLFSERYGDRRRPSVRDLEKEAYVWANREILSLEQAEEYIRQQKDRRSELNRIKALIGIRDRELTATETRYLNAWLDMGFREDAIAIAYDRTVTNTHSLKWPYMNKILQSWHGKNLHSPQEIEAGDSRRRPAETGAGEARPIDMDELRSILDKI